MKGAVFVNRGGYDTTGLSDLYEFRDSLKDIDIPDVSHLAYKVIFLNSMNESCTDTNYESLRFYNEITRRYLSAYGIDYVATGSQCYTVDDFDKLTDLVKRQNIELVVVAARMDVVDLSQHVDQGFTMD